MEYLNITFRLLAISQIVLFAIFIAMSNNPNRVKGVGVMLMLGFISYLGMPLIRDYTPYYELTRWLWLFSAIVPSMLLLFVFFIFEESCYVPKWMIAIILVSVGSSVWFQFAGGGLSSSPLWLQILKGVITTIAIVVIWQGRVNDLIELRTKVRNGFILITAVETLLIIFVEVITNFNPPLLLDTITQFWLMSCAMLINYFFARFNPQGMLLMYSPESPENESSAEVKDPVIVDLLERMSSERLYADHDLRVGTLAEKIGVPEYKLRQKINQELGYRNFNQFVNHYRIQEASVRLREDQRMPVLSIALDVGFRSISSFNSAFQQKFGVSPTEYRSRD